MGIAKAVLVLCRRRFVGMVKRIAVGSRHPKTLESVLLHKYRLYGALHEYALGLVDE